MTFGGTYEHTVDDRGRVAVPARYRHLFSEGAMLTLSPDRCVEVYTHDGFEEMAELITVEPATHLKGRRLRRGFYSHAWEVELDGQGRILIPSRLREETQLNGSVVISGRLECLEIWNRERWTQEMSQTEQVYGTEMESLE
jgi:MraZ protein